MATALIGMGSNIDPGQHLMDAAKRMRLTFQSAQFSNVYRSKAVGMDSDDFLNACCLLQHDWSYEILLTWLKALEDEHGRDRSVGSWKPRTLDLDIVMFDGELRDDDLYKYAHIFVPASELIVLAQDESSAFAEVKKVSFNL